jgi:hypothetical protein
MFRPQADGFWASWRFFAGAKMTADRWTLAQLWCIAMPVR